MKIHHTKSGNSASKNNLLFNFEEIHDIYTNIKLEILKYITQICFLLKLLIFLEKNVD